MIGASTDGNSVGGKLVGNMLAGGFPGPVCLVNPKHRQIDGYGAFQSIAALPEAPDLAVIATPPDTVPGLIAELGAKGTRAAVVITAGLSPDLRRDARRGTADLPPHHRSELLGISVPALGLNANFGMRSRPGKLAFLSQSGALVTGMLDWAEARGIGFSYVVSMGDMADVDVGDLLDFLAADIATGSILLYLETIPSARKFMSAARLGGARQAGDRDQVRPQRSVGESRCDPYRRACRQRRSCRRSIPACGPRAGRGARRTVRRRRDADLPRSRSPATSS